MIDWQFLFLAWELKGKYPAILDQPVARELFDDANTLLDQIIADGSFQARGVYGFWPAHAEGDDIVLGQTAVRFPMLRQQTGKPAGPRQPLPGRLHRPGRRPPRRVRGGHPRRRRRWPRTTRPSTTTTGRSWSRRWPTGSPRRSPSTSTCRPGATGSSRTPQPELADLHAERFRGIRPALGYPASPDHSEKQELFDLLGRRPSSAWA